MPDQQRRPAPDLTWLGPLFLAPGGFAILCSGAGETVSLAVFLIGEAIAFMILIGWLCFGRN